MKTEQEGNLHPWVPKKGSGTSELRMAWHWQHYIQKKYILAESLIQLFFCWNLIGTWKLVVSYNRDYNKLGDLVIRCAQARHFASTTFSSTNCPQPRFFTSKIILSTILMVIRGEGNRGHFCSGSDDFRASRPARYFLAIYRSLHCRLRRSKIGPTSG